MGSRSRRSMCLTQAIAFTFAMSRLDWKDRSWRRSSAALSPATRVVIGGQEKYQEDEEVSPIVAPNAASETVQESGGMIDMKAEASSGGSALMPKFALRFPFFILMLCLVVALVGTVTIDQHAGGSVSRHRHAGGGGGDVLQRHAAGADRSRHHQHLRALLYPGRQCRPQRVALADRRESHQDLLQAGHRSQRGTEQHRQPGHGRSAPSAAGNAAPGGAGHGRFNAAGLPGDAEGPGAERNAI